MQSSKHNDHVLLAAESRSSSMAMRCDQVRVIHTLGPIGTNLAAAGEEWFRKRGVLGEVLLHKTVENAVNAMPRARDHALLTCAVYPSLHDVVFMNLGRMEFIDSFIWPTYSMVLASRDGSLPSVVSTHPAPQSLVPSDLQKVLVTSNSMAAAECAAGRTDGCITTSEALRIYDLKVVKDFGEVPMVFTLHGQTGA